MKAVVQRVLRCSVSVNDEVISSIGRGIFVLLGISRKDSEEDIKYMVRKLLNTRLFDDEDGKRWSKSVTDKEYEVLCVSQFTLCHAFKGNKLDFHDAMKPDEAKAFYNKFLDQLKRAYKPELVKDGEFGAHMVIDICNDGPVTIDIASKLSEQDALKNKTENVASELSS